MISSVQLATHSSVLAWRIPGTGEPGGLPSMGSHRVGHDWSDLEAAAKSRPAFSSDNFLTVQSLSTSSVISSGRVPPFKLPGERNIFSMFRLLKDTAYDWDVLLRTWNCHIIVNQLCLCVSCSVVSDSVIPGCLQWRSNHFVLPAAVGQHTYVPWLG